MSLFFFEDRILEMIGSADSERGSKMTDFAFFGETPNYWIKKLIFNIDSSTLPHYPNVYMYK